MHSVSIMESHSVSPLTAGWVMNDEATTTFEATIDQMSEGHAFLFSTFGIVPKIGWQIGAGSAP